MIQVLHRAIAILEYLAEEPFQPQRLKTIAGRMSLNTATCANILKTLAERGLVARNGDRSGYQLGPWLDYMGSKSPYRQRLTLAAEPEIVRLANRTGETALLAIIHQGRRYVLCHANGNRALQICPEFVFRENVYQSASGRLLLAYQSDDEIKAVICHQGLPGNNWPKITTELQLHQALKQIRRQGFVVRQDQQFARFIDQIYGVACPVRQGDLVVASVALLVPAIRFQGAERGRLIRIVREEADRISRSVTSSIGGMFQTAQAQSHRRLQKQKG